MFNCLLCRNQAKSKKNPNKPGPRANVWISDLMGAALLKEGTPRPSWDRGETPSPGLRGRRPPHGSLSRVCHRARRSLWTQTGIAADHAYVGSEDTAPNAQRSSSPMQPTTQSRKSRHAAWVHARRRGRGPACFSGLPPATHGTYGCHLLPSVNRHLDTGLQQGKNLTR